MSSQRLQQYIIQGKITGPNVQKAEKIDAIGGTCHNGKIGVVGKAVSGLAKSDRRRNPEGKKT